MSSSTPILEQVLSLEKEQQDDLTSILKSTRLGAVIGAAKTVLDRLRFLESTQHLFSTVMTAGEW